MILLEPERRVHWSSDGAGAAPAEVADPLVSQSVGQPSTVFVVDDDESVRQSLEWMLTTSGFAVETFSTPRALLERYDPERPGCLVLDLQLPGMSGLELRKELSSRGGRHPFIVVTGHGEVPDAVEAMQQGAIDFIEKPYRRQQLVDRIRQGIERDLSDRQRQADRQRTQDRLQTLTAREKQVLRLVIENKMSREIATDLGVSPKTVEVHRSNLAKKMGVDTIASLVVHLVRLGIKVE